MAPMSIRVASALPTLQMQSVSKSFCDVSVTKFVLELDIRLAIRPGYRKGAGSIIDKHAAVGGRAALIIFDAPVARGITH